MQRLSYLVSYPFLWLISILPFPLFYRFSDLIFFLLYRVLGYRKKVVRSNLRLTFPAKSEAELRKIEKKFYRHMCDMFLESVKTMAISESDLRKRYLLPNITSLQQMEKQKSILLLFSHYGNWEWSIVVNRSIRSEGYAVYQKLNNPHFNNLIKRNRARWNTRPINQKETVRTVVKNEKSGIRGVYGIVSDQSPQAHRAQYWAPFMGITVPIFTGPETLARKLGLAVYFGKVNKLGRGYYSLEFVRICEDGQKTKEHEITNRFLQLVEEQVRAEPAFYLWTHRRWKHRNKVPGQHTQPGGSAG
jgi:KDO2-lipid IV(A) lauroyltransferase